MDLSDLLVENTSSSKPRTRGGGSFIGAIQKSKSTLTPDASNSPTNNFDDVNNLIILDK